MDERGAVRFNQFHAKAGSPTGGQFASSSGGSGSSTKPAAKAPAAKAATSTAPHSGGHGEKTRLLAQAHADEKRARELEKELHVLEQQHHAAQAAAKKSAASAAASVKAAAAAKKAGHAAAHKRHTAVHRRHSATHKHHAHHAATLAQKITSLKGEIHTLREHAAALEKQANAIRAASSDSGIPGVFPHQLAAWWEHGAGAAKIRWGQGGDFMRCVRLAVDEAHMDPEQAKGFCAERHHAALGIYPATHAAMEKHAGRAAMADTKAKPYGDVTYADPKNGKYPLDTEEHIRAAWSYINQADNAAKYPMNGVTLASVKSKITAAMKRIGADVADDSKQPASRAEFVRPWALEDIRILRSADGGDGRTVEAFAAVFNEPAEIHDHQGDYLEVIEPSAFNRAIDHASRARGGFPGSVKVLWNHGRDLSGNSSDRFTMPIGVPVEIRAEPRGLLTRTRYSETPLADEVLENIRSGAITSQSFVGAIMRSTPQLRRGDKYRPHGDGYMTVTRTELGLREYGPVLYPAYSGAEIFGVRMSTPGQFGPDPDEENDPGTAPDDAPATGDPLTPDGEHSARYHQHALYAMRSRELREKAGLVW